MQYLPSPPTGEKVPLPPFYHLNKRTHKPTPEMVGTRTVMYELAKHKSLSTRSLSGHTQLDRKSVRRYCEQLQKLGMMVSKEVERKNNTETQWSLTYAGRVVTLALSLGSKEKTGLNHREMVKRVVAESAETTPQHRLGKRIFEIMLKKGKEDLVMETVQKSVEKMYLEGYTDFWGAVFATAAGVSEDHYKFTLSVITEAFSTMTQKDVASNKMFIRYSIEEGVLMDAIEKGNESTILYFNKNIADPNHITVPYVCPICGHRDEKRKTSIVELLAAALSGRLPRCRGCGQNPKSDKIATELEAFFTHKKKSSTAS